jgi:hypothetical protein
MPSQTVDELHQLETETFEVDDVPGIDDELPVIPTSTSPSTSCSCSTSACGF